MKSVRRDESPTNSSGLRLHFFATFAAFCSKVVLEQKAAKDAKECKLKEAVSLRPTGECF